KAGQVQVGMVSFLLRDPTDAIEEVQRRREVLDAPLAMKALAVGGQLPVRQRRELRPDLRWAQRRNPSFARNAMLPRQFGSGRAHGWSSSSFGPPRASWSL